MQNNADEAPVAVAFQSLFSPFFADSLPRRTESTSISCIHIFLFHVSFCSCFAIHIYIIIYRLHSASLRLAEHKKSNFSTLQFFLHYYLSAFLLLSLPLFLFLRVAHSIFDAVFFLHIHRVLKYTLAREQLLLLYDVDM